MALLLVGKHGTGKTSFALQFEKPGVLDLDGNLDGPDAYLRRNKLKVDYTYLTPLVTSGGSVEDKDMRDATFDGLKELLADKEVKTIVVDSGTKLCEAFILWRLAKDQRDVMEINAWQPWRSAMIKFIHAARSAGKHFIMTIHEKPVYAPRQGKSIEPPQKIGVDLSVPTRLSEELGFIFTDVWRAVIEETRDGFEHKLHFISDGEIYLKNSFGLVEPLPMEWADMAPVLKGRL